MERLGALSFKVKVNDTIQKQHIDQLLASSEHNSGLIDDSFNVLPNSDIVESRDNSATNSSDNDYATATPQAHYPQ